MNPIDSVQDRTPGKTFVPRRRLESGHWMTIFCWAARRRIELPEPERRLFQVTSDTQVLADCYWQPDRTTRGTLLALHGLEGSSEAHYMRGLADKALRAGFNAILLNQRNCGGTEHLVRRPLPFRPDRRCAAVIARARRRPTASRAWRRRLFAGRQPRAEARRDYGRQDPPTLRGVCAVSPVLELSYASVRSSGGRMSSTSGTS